MTATADQLLRKLNDCSEKALTEEGMEAHVTKGKYTERVRRERKREASGGQS